MNNKGGPVFIEEACGCRVDHGIPWRCSLHPVGHRYGCARTTTMGDPMCEGCRAMWAVAAPEPEKPR